jgi:hypothetical protein
VLVISKVCTAEMSTKVLLKKYSMSRMPYKRTKHKIVQKLWTNTMLIKGNTKSVLIE